MKNMRLMIRKCAYLTLILFGTSLYITAQVEPVHTQLKGTELKEGKSQIAFSQSDFTSQASSKSEWINLPYLAGQKRFKIEEFNIYGKNKNPYPEIKTYRIHSEDGLISGRITDGPAGTSIIYLDRGQMIRIYSEPNAPDVYYQEVGISRDEDGVLYPVCNAHGEVNFQKEEAQNLARTPQPREKRNGSVKRIYRVAVMCTGEYYVANGGATTVVRQQAISNLNDISAIYEKDLGVFLEMSVGAPRIFSDPNTDPFQPDTEPGALGRTAQAQIEISSSFPTSRYDLGHVFHTHSGGDGWSSGGLAGLGVVCNDIRKAQAWSGSFNNSGNGFIQLAAHEFGHQFNATHTFNGISSEPGGNCAEGNHPIGTAYEIGSGTTIMSYQGLCDADQNIPSMGVLDNYFNINSLDRMVNFMEDFGVCNDDNWVPDNNTEPEVNANPCGAVLDLPRATPFILTGSATDADGDNLTYCWEGYDEDGTLNRDTHGLIGTDAGNTNDAPLWRSFPPTTSPTRYFPRLELVKDNQRSDFEVLPNRNRNMKMRLTVRDNNPDGGAIDWEEIGINVISTAGPLQVTAPNGGELVNAGETINVSWNPRGSEDLCVNATIKLSLDGGLTFPFTLATEVDYDAGNVDVTFPASLSNSDDAKVMVMCDDYDCFQWYDLSNNSFTLESNCFAPANLLCDTEPLELESGDPQLDLGVDIIRGNIALDYFGTVENTPPTMPVAVNDFNSNCTRIGSADNAFDTLSFRVTEAGSYTFITNAIQSDPNAIKAYAVFDAATFDSENACPSFLEGNASFISNQFGYFQQFTVELEACKTYLFASQITNADTRDIGILEIQGPGDFIPLDNDPDYTTTFVSVDVNTGEIRYIDPTGNLLGSEAGEFHIYAATYKSGGPTPPEDVDPQNWIGQTLNELLASGDCYRISENFKPVTIISTCEVFDLELLQQTPCDPLTNTYSQTIKFKVDKGPDMGTVSINGQVFAFSGDSLEATLTNLPSDGLPVDLVLAFSDEVTCNTILDDVFTAPVNCCPIDINFDGTEIVECVGTPVILDAGTDGVIYAWSKDGDLQVQTSSTLIVLESGNYEVTVTDVNGCVKIQDVQVTFFDLPIVVAFDDIEGCQGDMFTITPTVDEDSLQWFKDGVLFSEDRDIEVTESGEYILFAVNGAGCINSDTVQVTLLESPVVELGDDQVLCEGDTLILNGGDPGNFYGWVKDGTQLPDMTNTLTVTEDGVYIVVVVNQNQCDAIDQITVSFRELPDLELGTDITLCEGESVELDADANGFETEWLRDGMLIAGENTDKLTVSTSGTYTAVVSANEDCSIEDEITVTVNEVPVVDLGEDRLLCEGTDLELDSGAPDDTNVWIQGGVELMVDNNLLSVTESAEYIVSVTNEFNCTSSDTVNVSFNPKPDLELGMDQELCADDVFTIEAETNGFDIEWSLDGSLLVDESDLSLVAESSGEYT
ncbi:MAG: hypothetical protein HKN09_05505, partial [Saprospiraceae bacterium]|nr:hypothetical protein [Saprospiraceae bacterium]